MPEKTKNDWSAVSRAILDRLDIQAAYAELGVGITGRTPNHSGWLECKAFGRDDRQPSAAINVGNGAARGRYKDQGGDGLSCGLFDFAVIAGRFSDWKEARRHYAGIVGITLPKGGGGKPAKNPSDDVAWQDWNDTLAMAWVRHKPGITVESFRLNGGKLAKWPKDSGQFPIAVLPVFGPQLCDADPVGYVAWNRTGGMLPIYQGPGVPPRQVKMKSLAGSTAGWLGSWGLNHLATAEVVWKVEGPPDMMALFAIIPPELREKHVVITNSNGANEIPKDDLIEHLTGKTVYVIHDADKPGQGIPKDEQAQYDKHRLAGAKLWCQQIARFASEVRNVQLPYQIEENHGKDVRDFVAEGHKYEDLLALAHKAAAVERSEFPAFDGEEAADERPLSNAVAQVDGDGNVTYIPRPIAEIIDDVRRRTDGWPRRVGTALFVHDESHGIAWLPSAAALFGWLQSQAGIVEWRRSSGCVARDELHAELIRIADSYASIEVVPHEPLLCEHYYACPELPPSDGLALAALLDRFCPATPLDRDLIQAALLTAIWGGPGGTRPCFAITSDDGRGAGKSKLAEMIGHIAGGIVSFSNNEAIGDIKARLLSPEALTKRVALLDNVKSHRFSWSELEALITAPVISGKRMYVGEATRPNTLTWFITLNGASLSTDMAQRCVIIKVKRPVHSSSWEEETLRFVLDHRWQLIADLVACLRQPVQALERFSRWATWEKAVVAQLPEPGDVQALILERQGTVDVEGDEAEHLQEFFVAQLRKFGYDDERERVFIPSLTAARWLNWATGETYKVIAAGRILHQFISEGRLPRLRPNTHKGWGRGLVWEAVNAGAGATVWIDLDKRIADCQSAKDGKDGGF